MRQSAWENLPAEIASDLLKSARPHRLRAGGTLFSIGDPCDGCYRVDSGLLKLGVAAQQGEECILAILSSGAVIGDSEIIDRLPRSSAATALTDCTFQFVSIASFHDCAKQHPEIYFHLARLFAKRMQEAQQSIAALAYLNAKGRVARALLTIADSLGEGAGAQQVVIPRAISQKELAALAGVARENINRFLRDWEQRKLLSKLDHCYCITDKGEFERELAG
jgi:CRP-like cAMP-binding protein